MANSPCRFIPQRPDRRCVGYSQRFAMSPRSLEETEADSEPGLFVFDSVRVTGNVTEGIGTQTVTTEDSGHPDDLAVKNLDSELHQTRALAALISMYICKMPHPLNPGAYSY
ncbi:hypothetical protein LIA77_05956 [Sarocladium implicatum]|nr:hypothetical protein LIA77_05956 [Sarocladium implicatum]